MFKRCFEISTLIILILFFMVSSAFAFPNSINYQGKLTDSFDVPLDGEYLLTFKIYSMETWGTPLWIEEQTVKVTRGIYNAELGTVNPFPANLFETKSLYLEVIIFNTDTGMDETLSPRIPFNATGFSMKAKNADSVAWPSITGKPADFTDNTDDVNDADADPGNELQTLSTSGNNITLSKGGGSITAPYATNADMVDGKHASELGGGDGHSLDAADGSPVNAVYVNNVGNVGIGTTSPASRLHIFDFAPQVRVTHSGSGGKTVALSAGAVGTALSAGPGAPLIFRTDSDLIPGHSSNERMRISTSGNVGIGTTSPSFPLSLGSSLGKTKLALYETGLDNSYGLGVTAGHFLLHLNGSGAKFAFMNGDENNAEEIFTIKGTGNVGIGTTSPSYKLHVNGYAKANNWYTSSDYRLKKNITPIQDALSKVSILNGVEFEWRTEEYPEKEFNVGKAIGLIAQEVEEVLPEVVTTAEDGYKSVDYANIVPVLIEAIKVQQNQIEKLKARIEVLEY